MAILCIGLMVSLGTNRVNALTQGDYTYTTNELGQAAITSFNMSYSGALSITNNLGGCPVTSILGFEHCEGLTIVTIPDGVTRIGSYAFDGCFGMTSVSIPSSVINIGYNAFQYCIKLPSITIPASVTSMDGSVFSDCPCLKGIFFKGNAPRCTGGAFTTSSKAPVYYLPGTTNWGATFLIYHPTYCWNPQVQRDSGFGFASKRFGFNITGTTNIPVVVEASTNISSGVWTPLTNTTLGVAGTLKFSDPSSTNYPSRFYRIVWP